MNVWYLVGKVFYTKYWQTGQTVGRSFAYRMKTIGQPMRNCLLRYIFDALICALKINVKPVFRTYADRSCRLRILLGLAVYFLGAWQQYPRVRVNFIGIFSLLQLPSAIRFPTVSSVERFRNSKKPLPSVRNYAVFEDGVEAFRRKKTTLS